MKKCLLSLFFFMQYGLGAQYAPSLQPPAPSRIHHHRQPVGSLAWLAGSWLTNLFTPLNYGILLGATPLYLGLRTHDIPFQKRYYCATHHRNIRQFPRALYHTTNIGIAGLLVGLASSAWWSSTKAIQKAGTLFAITLPLSWGIKNLLKRIQHTGAIRPFNQYFRPQDTLQSYGGFPSGHMMEACYATLLFGYYAGSRWGIPLALFSGTLAVSSITSNRHFPSQIFAGAALGCMLGTAAITSVREWLQHTLHMDILPASTMMGVCLSRTF